MKTPWEIFFGFALYSVALTYVLFLVEWPPQQPSYSAPRVFLDSLPRGVKLDPTPIPGPADAFYHVRSDTELPARLVALRAWHRAHPDLTIIMLYVLGVVPLMLWVVAGLGIAAGRRVREVLFRSRPNPPAVPPGRKVEPQTSPSKEQDELARPIETSFPSSIPASSEGTDNTPELLRQMAQNRPHGNESNHNAPSLVTESKMPEEATCPIAVKDRVTLEEGLPEGETRRKLSDSIIAFFARRPHAIPSLIAAAMLFAAMSEWPYDYYTLMRWVVCAVGVFTAYQSCVLKRFWGAWVFGPVALLFNPVAPVHLSRETWQVLDPAAAIAFLIGIVLIRSCTDTTGIMWTWTAVKSFLASRWKILIAVAAVALLAYFLGAATHKPEPKPASPVPVFTPGQHGKKPTVIIPG